MTAWLGVMLYCMQLKPNPIVIHINDFECSVNITTSHPFATEKECKEESEKNHYGKARCLEIKI